MAAAGLYDPRFEHDACGVGFVADLSGRGGHDVVARALLVLCNLEHRGAKGGDPGTGDGAGILTQIPDEFFRATCDFELPEAGAYAAGMAFFSAERHLVTPALARLAAAEGLTIIGWREVPFDITACGDGARAVLPDVLQLFVAGAGGQRGMELERMAFCLRKRAEHEAGVYFASLSARTIVYKGMLSAVQLEPFYPYLSDPAYTSALALVHSRFSTNTFPSWPLAHPYRYVAHNGEINTVRGNRNWMRAREAMLASELIPASRDGQGIERLFPILDEDASDSASFDECLELLHMGGRSLPHAVLMMIPEPWENHEEMTPERRAFYRYHAALMEPWDGPALIAQQRLHGYTEEELRVILAPMARAGTEPIGSMGTDTPVAVLSGRPRLMFDYFTQLFAQVTNPPLDAIREELVTSLGTITGPEQNLLHPIPASCRQIVLPYPVIDDNDLAKIVHINDEGNLPGFASHVVDGRYNPAGGGEGLRVRLADICAEVSAAIEAGARLIILSDRPRGDGPDLVPIPSLLLTGTVHHHLIKQKSRTRAGLVVEAGDVRECHHIALLVGYGAAAVNPYLAIESVRDLVRRGVIENVSEFKAEANLLKALGKGLLKIMSKMGVSTVASYTGAQIFEAVGLGPEVIETCFAGTTSRLSGVGFDQLAGEISQRTGHATGAGAGMDFRRLDTGGEYQWRREGEPHLFSPEVVFKLQHATRSRRYEIFKEYTSLVDDQSRRLMTLRGLLRIRGVDEEAQAAEQELRTRPVRVEDVEPVASIVRRFATGAMSYGSISAEAHQTPAIAMNRLGARSNTGEVGEDPDRFIPDANGDLRRSAVKQVASGRFGVTSEYLVDADDLQIKMAQGAKPGEGGQLPGHKVYPWIAKTRYSTPGVGLISPPPHHDIYSIEDLKQLIHDLKNANPRARVHVKLVAETGVGTVAAGVSKAKADVVLISGHDGGTGAAPLTSLKHAGLPWELGLAETQQTLLLNGLRDRITVQVDGAMKTGRDVIIGALLGAEEFGFATAPLVVSGCIMMRVCHLDTCPVGVATQNPELRKRFTGRPEFVVNFFEFVAEQVRELLASLGFRSLDEAIGHVEVLDTSKAIEHWKADGLDLTPILASPVSPYDSALRRTRDQDHGLDAALDNTLIQLCEGALLDGDRVSLELPVRNVNRTVGTMLGSYVTRRYGAAGLPDGTIDITFRGSAGQSFGAFVPHGMTLRLVGDANDYLGKGLSGGVLAVRPDERAPFVAEQNVLAGNVIAYGATSGEIYLRGVVGERFCVRNSGATAVAEGTGDHALEYMTGGLAVILGPTGRNVGAGMSGGVAFVLDLDRSLVNGALVDVAELRGEDALALRAVLEQ